MLLFFHTPPKAILLGGMGGIIENLLLVSHYITTIFRSGNAPQDGWEKFTLVFFPLSPCRWLKGLPTVVGGGR